MSRKLLLWNTLTAVQIVGIFVLGSSMLGRHLSEISIWTLAGFVMFVGAGLAALNVRCDRCGCPISLRRKPIMGFPLEYYYFPTGRCARCGHYY